MHLHSIYSSQSLRVQYFNPIVNQLILRYCLVVHEALHFNELFLIKHGLGIIKVDTERLYDVYSYLVLSSVEHFRVFSKNAEHDSRLGISTAPVSLMHQLLCLFFELFELNLCGLCVREL